MGELVVRDDDVLIYLGDSVDIIKHTTENRIFSYFEQGLGEVLGELTKTGGVACCYNHTFHISFPLFEHG
jgi:hypothetical protein